jgi:hypothetical protein
MAVSISNGAIFLDGKPLLFGVFGEPGSALRFSFQGASPADALPSVAAFLETFRMVAYAQLASGERKLVEPVPGVLVNPHGAAQ